MEKNKNNNRLASFGVFLTTFLVISTVIVFAVLLFLYYENTINNLKSDTVIQTENTCHDVVADCSNFFLSSDSDDELSTNINLYVKSAVFNDNGEIYITDLDGIVYYSNLDEYDRVLSGHNDAILLKLTRDDVPNTTSEITNSYYQVISMQQIPNTSYYCVVKQVADLDDARSEFFSLALLPSIISLIMAISLFVVLTQLMIRPLRAMSRVMDRVGEGDYSVRVDKKFTNYDDQSITISDDLQNMARTVNDMIEKLENQEADRNVFISSVAHDIRTPLTSINGFVTAMLDGTIPPEKQDKYLMMIKSELDRIRRLIMSMTEASSLNKTDPELMEEFDFNEMSEDIRDNLEPQLKDKNITFDLKLCKENHIVYGQSQELCRVVMNIVTNAIKFTPEGGKIILTSEADLKNNHLLIYVEDSGPGVEKEKRNRVFESFYKADSSRKQEGFGLGLYICKQILAGHGQTIYLDESPALGGARFVFSFPYPPEREK